MKCLKCNREVSNNLSVCPHCGVALKNKKEVIRTSKNAKSAIKSNNSENLVGGYVTKSSFIKLRKTGKKIREIERKDYNNYIDYKEAKEKQQEEIRKSKIANHSKSLISDSESVQEINKVKASKSVNKAIALNEKNVNVKNSSIKTKSVKKEFTQEEIYGKKDICNSSNNIINNVQWPFKEEVSPKKGFINIVTEENNDSARIRKNKRGIFNFLAYSFVIVLWAGMLIYVFGEQSEDFYFSESNSDTLINKNQVVDTDLLEYNGVSKSGQTGGASSEGVTSIVYDNQYFKQLTLTSDNDVRKLIIADSVKQKNNCPNNIVKIENEIVENYGITAVNLCEIDEDFALEIKNVVDFIYNKYPKARYYLTNITLANVGSNNNYIAAFMPSFSFATSNTKNEFPVGIKTQIILNASSFLNMSKFKSSVNYSSKSGYFPPNATRSSTVAHEFGHYLSYVALLNSYDTRQLNFVKATQYATLTKVIDNFDSGIYSYELLTEAYNEYRQDYHDVSFDEFRRSISKYAMAKDKNGLYIYDETIAEAFHDVYINGDGAKPASKYIIKVLESKL